MSAGDRLRLGILSDIHCAPVTAEPYTWQNTVDLPHSIDLLDGALDWLSTQSIDQLVLLGDLTEDADRESFAVVRARAFALGVPILAVPGNCDVDWTARSLTAFRELASDSLTIGPANVDVGSALLLELIDLEPASDAKRLRGIRAPDRTTPAPTRRIVLTHYPVLDLETPLLDAGFRHSGNLINRAELESDLRALDIPVVVIHGHLHIHDAQPIGPLLHLSCGPLIEPPHLVSIVEIAGNEVTITVTRHAHSIREDQVDHLPVFTPLHQQWTWSKTTGHWA